MLKNKLYLGLLLVSLSWGTSFTAVKLGLNYLTTTELVLSRIFLSAILFAIILFLLREKISLRVQKKDILLVTWLAFVGIASYFPLQTYAIYNTITLHSALIMATSPIFAGVMTVLAGQERMNVPRAVGICTAFSGVFLIVLSSSTSQVNTDNYPNMLLGDGILVLNAVAWAHFTITGKRLMNTYDPFVIIAYIFIIGALMLIPYALVVHHTLEDINLMKNFVSGWSLPAIILYLSGVCAVYSYYMWYRGVKVLGAVNTAVFMYINPLFATVAGILVLGEELTVYNIMGGIAILLGVYMVNRR